MPRRQFVADLQKATESVSIAGVSDVQPGNDDGEFTFMCEADGQILKISALVPELSDYPTNHTCMFFVPDNASSSVASILAGISAAGKTVAQTMELVSRKLESIDGDGDQQMLDSQQFNGFEDAEDSYDDDGDEYFPGDEDAMPMPSIAGSRRSVPLSGFAKPTSEFRQRIRRDLSTAKSKGFKVGYLGGLTDGWGCYVSLSIRIAKLGISEEAMKAWDLEPTDYLIVLYNYPSGYKSMDDIRAYDTTQAQRSFGVRVGVSSTYKPSMQEAVQAFTVLSKDKGKRHEKSQGSESQEQSAAHKGFRQSFISRPLNEFLEQRFHMLLKYRYSGMPWNGAELFYNEQILRPSQTHSSGSDDKYFKPELFSTAYPSFITADHIQETQGPEHSLPLVCMQFVLRHFVRCTEFCLICFSKMPDDLQAIKPYVCDNPLCLYQYMSLGFGPSIEHEILSQPKVVDLLISFCYASAREGRLKDFPSGLALSVPPSRSHDGGYQISSYSHPYQHHTIPAAPEPAFTDTSQDEISIKYNAKTYELLFEDSTQLCPVKVADWIVLRTNDIPSTSLNCRVIDTSLYPCVQLAEPVLPAMPIDAATQLINKNPNTSVRDLVGAQPAPKPPVAEFRSASFYIYNQNFDDIPEHNKRQAILALLDVLPPVRDMKKYLSRKSHSSLSAWVNRIPPAALGVLRWIIASNRACILQVDDENESDNIRKAEDRLYGMSGWTQFRFAMGAPDKERRFIQAVRATSNRLRLSHPTLFAWHGSPMKNWHSIIREGLNFAEVSHGRAFGHGVYHSLVVQTSLGYSQFHMQGNTFWPYSELKIQQALALNEIVNAPHEFVSANPHIVVAQLDWIQTRYLFVKATTSASVPVSDKGNVPLEILEQDPIMTPQGMDGKLIIPAHAVSSRRPKANNTNVHKRQKTMGTSKYDAIDVDADDDASSVATLEEDLSIFQDDDSRAGLFDRPPTPNSTRDGKGKPKSKIKGSKSYVPGTLDYGTLPMLQQPAWASTAATKCLMRDFKNLVAAQNERPLHELGWHIDEDKIENMYQWIVELHSFDPALPLAKDMEKRSIKSVVLELRFGKDYPMSPPFVRVVRPRFLSFAQGGGGNVTAGGAMCMELLTNDGWSAVSSIESVLLQVRVAITSLDKPARLDTGGRKDYGVGEAVEAYMRACNMHGWTVPAGFKEMAYGGAEGSYWDLK